MTRRLPDGWEPSDGSTGDPDHRGPGGSRRPPTGQLTPTDTRTVVVAALCGAAVGWFALSLYKVADAVVPVLPWSLPIILTIVAVGVWVDARVLARRVAQDRRRVGSTEGLVSLALGKALVLTGAALAGALLVYVVTFVGHVNIPFPRQRVIRGLVATAVCVLLAWAGLRLEKACQVPGAGSGEDDGKGS